MFTNSGKRGLRQCGFGTTFNGGKSGVMAQPLNVSFGGLKNAAHRR
jgi:hypothetical protein